MEKSWSNPDLSQLSIAQKEAVPVLFFGKELFQPCAENQSRLNLLSRIPPPTPSPSSGGAILFRIDNHYACIATGSERVPDQELVSG